MKNNSIPDFPLDTTTLNSTEIPKLDTQTANQFLNNVLEACDMEPRHFFEVAKGRMKFKCPKISHTGGCISCTYENPCSNAKYGRTIHLVLKDNPRLFNTPPRSSKEKKKLQSPHQRLKLLLIISITPTIRPSPYIHALHLHSATRKISLSFRERPLTSYPSLRPSLHRNGYLQISPSIQIFPQLFLPYGYFHRLLPL